MTNIEEFWKHFLRFKFMPQDLHYQGTYCFELNPKTSQALLDLVLLGKKRATCSALPSFELQHEALPKVGDYNIITDFEGHPYGVVRNTKITVLPYQSMTFELCSKEGEDDNLESWQRGHQKFFTQESQELGYRFTPTMPVVFEEFELVYQEPLIREALLESAEECGIVHYQAWQETYQGMMSAEFLKHMKVEKHIESARRHYEHTLEAVVAGKVVGFVCYDVGRDADKKEQGEIQAIYLLKAYHGQGIGSQLMGRALARLLKHDEVYVWVLKDNKTAIKFYERWGFVKDGKENQLPLGTPVTEIRMVKHYN